MHKPVLYVCICLLTSLANPLKAQDSSSVLNKLLSFPDKVFAGIDRQSTCIEEQLTHRTTKLLNRLERQEEQFKRKLWKTDSLKFNELLQVKNLTRQWD
jgi:hypothetical protein